MNPNQPSREQIEARITAMLLGELPDEEAMLLRWTISQDAALKKLHDELAQTIVLVRKVEKPADVAAGENKIPLKLSDDRRKKLLAHFQTPRSPASKELFWLKRIEISSLVTVLALLAIVGLIAAISIPNFVKARATSQSNAIINNLRQIDAAKNQWALENKKPADAVVTMDDLKPYLKNGTLPSVAGEKYVIGKVSEPVVADVDAAHAKKLGSLASRLPARGQYGSHVWLSTDGSVDENGAAVPAAALPPEVVTLRPEPVVAPPPAEIVLPKPDSTPEAALQNETLAVSAPSAGSVFANPPVSDSPAPAAPQPPATATFALAAAGTAEAGNGTYFAENQHTVDTQKRLAQVEKPDVAGEFISRNALTTPPHALDSSEDRRDEKNRYARNTGAIVGVVNAFAGAGGLRDRSGGGGGGGTLNYQAGTSAISPAAGLPSGQFPGTVGNELVASDSAQTIAANNGWNSDGDIAMAQNQAVVRGKFYLNPVNGSEANKLPALDDLPASGKLFGINGCAGNAPAPTAAPSSPATAVVDSFEGGIRSPENKSETAKPLSKFDSDGTLLANDFETAGNRRATSGPSYAFNFDVVKRNEIKPENRDQNGLAVDSGNGESKSSVEVAQNSAFQQRLQNTVSRPAAAQTTNAIAMNDVSGGLAVNADKLNLGSANTVDLGSVKTAAMAVSEKEESRLIAQTKLPAPVPQPEILCRENNFSTFSLNVSDVSFKLAAASLENGRMPDGASIRSEEFINAFDYRDPEAAAGQPVAFTSERARYPFAQNRDLLRFSIKTAAAGRAADRPLNLVLLLDKSGSMERADRVAIIREAMRVLAAQLHPQDTVSVVTFARTARLWADGVAGDKAGETLEQVGGITPEGGTNLEEAMRLAYETARRHYLATGMNRVVLLTDGAANLGNVDAAALKEKVEAQRKQGIALDCFGIGWEDFNDDMLAELSGNGDGRYAFINTPEEAGTEFAAKLAGALQVAAQDVKVQVEFNPQRVVSWRQIGYAKHQLTKEQFRDNSVLAAEIAAQEAGNALYTVETKPDGVGPVATVHVRYKIPGTEDVREHSWDVDYTGNAPALEQASVAMRLAATASAFSEWLAASPFAQEVTPDELLKTMSGVPEIYGADQRPKKLVLMLLQAKSLSGK
jgi:Mg-chelatase subunit ChlD/type II secretory pathway pseudopilin PulG